MRTTTFVSGACSFVAFEDPCASQSEPKLSRCIELRRPRSLSKLLAIFRSSDYPLCQSQQVCLTEYVNISKECLLKHAVWLEFSTILKRSGRPEFAAGVEANQGICHLQKVT